MIRCERRQARPRVHRERRSRARRERRRRYHHRRRRRHFRLCVKLLRAATKDKSVEYNVPTLSQPLIFVFLFPANQNMQSTQPHARTTHNHTLQIRSIAQHTTSGVSFSVLVIEQTRYANIDTPCQSATDSSSTPSKDHDCLPLSDPTTYQLLPGNESTVDILGKR